MHEATAMIVGRKGAIQVVISFVDFESNFKVRVVYLILGGHLIF